MREAMLGAIVVFTLVACSSNTHQDNADPNADTGEGGATTAAGGTAAGGTAVGGAATRDGTGVCTSSLNAGGRTGAATITYMAQTMTLPERACETLRRPDGSAFGWAAYYGPPPTKQSPERQFPGFSVTVTRGFVGDGTYQSGDYADGYLAVEWFIKLGEVGSGTASPTALVVAHGAKSAVLDVEDVIHAELSCDPTDDTGTNAVGVVDANAAPPGFAYLVDGYGALRKFDCVRCNSFLNTLSVNAPSVAPDYDTGGYGSHTFFSLSSYRAVNITGPGRYDLEGRFGWRVGSRYFTAMSDVTAVKPGAGTFTVRGMAEDMSGSFQCPSDSF